MYFPSKKDMFFRIIIWGCIAVCFLPLLREEYYALFFTVPLALLMMWGWFKTGYFIEREELIIQSGPLKKRIVISEIEKIVKTKNPLSAPALSIDRLEISYGKFELALVSPKDKHQFITQLKHVNPNIEVDRNID